MLFPKMRKTSVAKAAQLPHASLTYMYDVSLDFLVWIVSQIL